MYNITMDTSLNTDTLHGVQPTRVADYMLGAAQVPVKECKRSTYRTGGCSVRNNKHNAIDAESVLFGLDRRITKQEPPTAVKHTEPTHSINSHILDSFSPFESVGTREKRPDNVLSGVSIDRFEYVKDAQNLSHIISNEPFRGGFQTRIAAADCSIKKCGKQLKLKETYGTRCFE